MCNKKKARVDKTRGEMWEEIERLREGKVYLVGPVVLLWQINYLWDVFVHAHSITELHQTIATLLLLLQLERQSGRERARESMSKVTGKQWWDYFGHGL